MSLGLTNPLLQAIITSFHQIEIYINTLIMVLPSHLLQIANMVHLDSVMMSHLQV